MSEITKINEMKIRNISIKFTYMILGIHKEFKRNNGLKIEVVALIAFHGP